MLIMAEGTVHQDLSDKEIREVQAWFGPMIDGGFLHSGYLDFAGRRLWLILSSCTLDEADQRLNDLPIVHKQLVTFNAVAVAGLRFT